MREDGGLMRGLGGLTGAEAVAGLNTILTNYNENASLVISTHLIADVENVLVTAGTGVPTSGLILGCV